VKPQADSMEILGERRMLADLQTACTRGAAERASTDEQLSCGPSLSCESRGALFGAYGEP